MRSPSRTADTLGDQPGQKLAEPTNEALEHDRAERPPIAFLAIPLLKEDFWGDLNDQRWTEALTHVVWRPDRGVCQLPPIGLPRRDVLLVRHREVDRVDHDRVA